MQKSKLKILRKKYPIFIYESYDWKIKNNDLEIVFAFSVPPASKFAPKIIIKNINKSRLQEIGSGALENLIFNIGLIEIPSYWKATCSPQIEIAAGCLNQEQIQWWHDLLINGMGQFYYENKINFKEKNFLTLKNSPLLRQRKQAFADFYRQKLKNRYLVPFAGGRDSIVTLEKLKEKYGNDKISLFTVNPIEKIQKTVRVTGIEKQIIVKRIIDKKLLEMNKGGFLNGHTPFTALLSFISVFCALLFDYKNIAFSNEKSANEGNAKYLGKIINHQWAKSSAFEKMFSDYTGKYLAKNINYFSYLRKYGELEISKMLTKYPQYFPVFSSCNAGMKVDNLTKARWCGNCPKCLFVYLSLYPFLDEKNLLKIFGKDLFENKNLLPIMRDLLETDRVKPLECVGTKSESKKAAALCLKKARAYRRAGKKEGKIPFLLDLIK